MHIDFFGFALGSPFAARILEIADQFLLFRIDRDDRLAVLQKTASLFVDVFKLSIPVHMLASFVDFPVGLSPTMQLPQAERRPQLPSHRVTSRHRFKQRLEIGKEGWVLGYPRCTSATPPAYPVIPN